jgi:hypothetical protein
MAAERPEQDFSMVLCVQAAGNRLLSREPSWNMKPLLYHKHGCTQGLEHASSTACVWAAAHADLAYVTEHP